MFLAAGGSMRTASEIAELEGRPRLTGDEHAACFEFYEARLAAAPDARERAKLARPLGYHATQAFEAGMRDPAWLDRLLAALEAAAKVSTSAAALRKTATKIR